MLLDIPSRPRRKLTAHLQVPAILKGLRSPHRPPLARTLATSIESAQAKSTEEVSKRFSRPVVTSQPQPAPAPAAPKPTLRRPPSTTSLSASTLGRNSSSSYAPFRPSKSTTTREHQSLSASTSRLPRNSAEGAGRLSASTSLYPTLSGSAPVDVWGTSREATSRRLAPATSHKGKQRESLDPLPFPPPAPAPVFSTAAPKANHLNTSTRNFRAVSPPPPSPPQPQFNSPPRAEPLPIIPPTPAPPGAFHSSFAASSPALPRAAALVQEEERVAQNSPRAKASSAIAGLADELGGGMGDDLGLSFGPGKRKGGGIGGLGSGDKRVKTGATAKAAPRTRKTRQRIDEDDVSGESGDDYVEEEPKSQKGTSPRKRKAPTQDQRDAEDDGVETQGRTASRRLATSTRRAAAPASSSSKPTAASSRSKTSIPLATSRSRTSRSAATATSTPASTSDDEDHGLARSTRRKVSTAESTVVAPARKARRVALGRQRQQETEQEMEVDGVPVVVRRTAGRR